MDLNNNPLTGAVEIAFNRFLALNPEAQETCSGMAGKHLAVQLKNTPLRLDFLPNHQGIQLGANIAAKPDATIEAGAFELAQMALSQQSNNAMVGQLRIEGDMELAQRFQGLLKNVDFDWEELLSQQIGDVAAYEIGKGLRSLFSFGREAAKGFAVSSAEFIQEEQRDVAAPHEVEEFCNNVDTLRDDVARLEARLLQLELAKGNG